MIVHEIVYNGMVQDEKENQLQLCEVNFFFLIELYEYMIDRVIKIERKDCIDY